MTDDSRSRPQRPPQIPVRPLGPRPRKPTVAQYSAEIDELKAEIAKRDARIVYLRAQLGLDADGVPIDDSPTAKLFRVIRDGNDSVALFLDAILDDLYEITPGAVERDWTTEEDGGSSGCAV